MSTNAQILSGVTLYSFTPDFHARRYSTVELIKQVAERGLGPGLEIVGFQSIRGFPTPTREVINELRAAIDESGLQPACLAVNVDVGLRADSFLSEDELVEYMERQLAVAAELRFPVVRVQYGAGTRVLERLLPFAERHELKMGIELHCPARVDTPWVVAVRELCERSQSPALGFIPDFGAAVTQLSPSLIDEFRRRGASDELLSQVTATWESLREVHSEEDRFAAIRDFVELARTPEERSLTQQLGLFAAGLHGQENPEHLAELFPYVVHIHGKFFSFDANGNEPAIPHEKLLTVLVENDYRGYISSEWEGWHWDWRPDAFEKVASHHRLCNQILERLGAGSEAA